MSGGSSLHNDIVQNFVLALRPKLRGSGCRIKIDGMRLVVRDEQYHTYPDVMVSCHPDDREAGQQYRHPVLIVEVLSPPTEAYDRTLKFNQYKNLPSLRHYVLVSQNSWIVEWYQLTKHGVWAHTALAEAADFITIPELKLTLTLAGMYDETAIVPMRIDFGAGPETRPNL
ncbi:MAG: Uma2 family endonuclease [Cytophagaceae bacterium]|nr:MAG: Uma2 family endonuclease [Cytophagaceae bacterium]